MGNLRTGFALLILPWASGLKQNKLVQRKSFHLGGIHSTDFYTGMNPIVIEMGLCLKVTGEFLVTMNNRKSHVNKNPGTEEKRLIEESKRNNGMGGKNKFAFRLHSKVMLIHHDNHTTICVFMCTHM